MTLRRHARHRGPARPRIDTSGFLLPKPGDKARAMAIEAAENQARREPSAALRRAVYARDAGVCALCHLDTDALNAEWNVALKADFQQYTCNICGNETKSVPCIHCNAVTCSRSFIHRTAFREKLEALGFTRDFSRKYVGQTLWNADHSLPVVEGGGGLGAENARTLCLRCHTKVTAELAETRAMRRRHAR